jgi:2-haloacid dehalogenase
MKPRWTLFDLNGTLLDPGGIGTPLGLSREESLAAFDDAIAGSMAETMSGSYRPLPEFLRAALVARGGGDAEIEAAMERAKRMPPYPDCAAALEHLRAAGIKTGVLTNSARHRAVEGLEAAGLIESFDLVAGSDEVEVFKPDPRMYRLGIERTGARAEEICMVASHWWDLMGAQRAGMRGGFVQRDGRPFMASGPKPDFSAATLDGLAAQISS